MIKNEISMETIIIAVIALLVLIILSVLVIRNSGEFESGGCFEECRMWKEANPDGDGVPELVCTTNVSEATWFVWKWDTDNRFNGSINSLTLYENEGDDGWE